MTDQLRRSGDQDGTSEVFDLAQDFLCVIGSDGYFKRLNPTWTRTLGYTSVELMTMPFLDFVHPDDRLGTEQRAAQITPDAPLDLFENRYRCKDGSYRLIAWSAAARAEPPILFAVGRDITDQRRAERELAQSEQRLRSVLAGAPIAVVTVNRDGQITFADGSVFSQIAVAPSSLVGLHMAEALRGWSGFPELHAQALERDVQTGYKFGDRTFNVRMGPHRLTSGGEIVGILVLAFDTTEQTRAEQGLAKRASQQSVLLELTRAGLDGLDTAVFLAHAIDLVARGSDTQFGTVLAVRPSGDSLEQVAAFGFSHRVPEDLPGIAGPMVGDDLMNGGLRFAVALDYQRNPGLHRSQWMIEQGVVSSMTVGIYGSTSPYGILSVHSTVARDFSPDDLQFIELASTIISVAVERQRGEKQRKMLLGRMVDAQEAERNAIALEIHDDAIQVMTAVNLRGALFQRALTDPAQLLAARELQEAVSLATGRLRSLLATLTPPALDRHGLAAGFKRHLEQFQASTGLHCELSAELDNEPVPEVRILLFRIFQEALTNVRKHAHAETIVVSLTSVDGGVMMRVNDDGDGCPPSALEPREGHLGVAAMRERAGIAGGWWGLTSERGHGSEVLTWVPVARDVGAGGIGAGEAVRIV